MIKVNPSPILISIGPIKIYWYGLLIFLSFWLIFLISLTKRKKYNLSKDEVFDLSFFLFLGGIIGARLYHVILDLSYYRKNPIEILYFWQGGFGIFGALIFGFFVLFIFSKNKKISLFSLLDFYSPLIILAIAIIRWGNFFNQELYGIPTNQKWGLFISLENRLPGFENFSYFHPLFFYESIFCLFLFLFLSFREKNKKFEGELFFWTFIFYPLFRFFIEYIKLDTQPIFLFLKINQLVSIFVLTFNLFLFRLRFFKQFLN